MFWYCKENLDFDQSLYENDVNFRQTLQILFYLDEAWYESIQPLSFGSVFFNLSYSFEKWKFQMMNEIIKFNTVNKELHFIIGKDA